MQNPENAPKNGYNNSWSQKRPYHAKSIIIAVIFNLLDIMPTSLATDRKKSKVER